MKKLSKILLTLALILVIGPVAVLFSACGLTPEPCDPIIIEKEVEVEVEPTLYTVQFFDDDGDIVKGVMVREGENVSAPTKNPVKEGYEFIGWFDGDNEITDFSNISTNLTVTAKYEFSIEGSWRIVTQIEDPNTEKENRIPVPEEEAFYFEIQKKADGGIIVQGFAGMPGLGDMVNDILDFEVSDSIYAYETDLGEMSLRVEIILDVNKEEIELKLYGSDDGSEFEHFGGAIFEKGAPSGSTDTDEESGSIEGFYQIHDSSSGIDIKKTAEGFLVTVDNEGTPMEFNFEKGEDGIYRLTEEGDLPIEEVIEISETLYQVMVAAGDGDDDPVSLWLYFLDNFKSMELFGTSEVFDEDRLLIEGLDDLDSFEPLLYLISIQDEGDTLDVTIVASVGEYMIRGNVEKQFSLSFKEVDGNGSIYEAEIYGEVVTFTLTNKLIDKATEGLLLLRIKRDDGDFLYIEAEFMTLAYKISPETSFILEFIYLDENGEEIDREVGYYSFETQLDYKTEVMKKYFEYKNIEGYQFDYDNIKISMIIEKGFNKLVVTVPCTVKKHTVRFYRNDDYYGGSNYATLSVEHGKTITTEDLATAVSEVENQEHIGKHFTGNWYNSWGLDVYSNITSDQSFYPVYVSLDGEWELEGVYEDGNFNTLAGSQDPTAVILSLDFNDTYKTYKIKIDSDEAVNMSRYYNSSTGIWDIGYTTVDGDYYSGTITVELLTNESDGSIEVYLNLVATKAGDDNPPIFWRFQRPVNQG